MADKDSTSDTTISGGTTNATSEVIEPTVTTPDFKAELEKVRAEFDQKIKEERGHFKQLADRQSARFQSEAALARQRALRAEQDLTTMKQQYFDNLDTDQKIAYQAREIETLKRGHQALPPLPPVDMPTSPTSPSPQEALFELVKAQGLDPADRRIDYALDDGSMEGLKRFGRSLSKIRQEDSKKMSDEELSKIKKEVRREVEKEHEVGEFTRVERGGAIAPSTGKRFKRSELMAKLKTPYQMTKVERAEALKALEEGRVIEG